MANPEHLALLKQGVEAWNRWRDQHPKRWPDLREVKLRDAELRKVDLHGANLSQAELAAGHFTGADLSGANLSNANLRDAELTAADLREADLSGANLRHASLIDAQLREADVRGADLSEAIVWATGFNAVDLSSARGLDTMRHEGPSSIGIDTIYRSKGNIPEVFLRGAGVPEDFIVYMRSLAAHPIEFYSCFISYSSKDDDFARRLHADLQQNGVRCWFAPEDLKIGDKFRTRIDESIRLYDKLIVILTENSIRSAWVEEEVEAALEKEHKQGGKLVLFPIRLDDAVMETDQALGGNLNRWPAPHAAYRRLPPLEGSRCVPPGL